MMLDIWTCIASRIQHLESILPGSLCLKQHRIHGKIDSGCGKGIRKVLRCFASTSCLAQAGNCKPSLIWFFPLVSPLGNCKFIAHTLDTSWSNTAVWVLIGR